MRALLLLCCCLAAHAVDSLVFDQAVRYVNDDVITLGEIVDRFQQQVMELRRAKKPVPVARDETIKMVSSMLEELTDDTLLLQYADTLRVRINTDLIAQSELDRARAEGRNLSIADQARRRQMVERRERINAVLQYFDMRTAFISPTTLLNSYQQRLAEFRRPARAKVFQIWMRPSDAAERDAVRKAKVDQFKQAQASTDAAINKSANDRLAAYLEAGDEKKDQVLDEWLAELIALSDKGGLQGDGPDIAEAARAVREREGKLKTLDDVVVELDKLRSTLSGKGVDAFKAAAKQSSVGPRKEEGGELGWVEPGQYSPAWDEKVFALKPGEMTGVFTSEQTAILVLVELQEAAAQRSFAEVSGELENMLARERKAAVRARAVSILRQKASIRDLARLENVLPP